MLPLLGDSPGKLLLYLLLLFYLLLIHPSTYMKQGVGCSLLLSRTRRHHRPPPPPPPPPTHPSTHPPTYRELVARYSSLEPGATVDLHDDMRFLTLEAGQWVGGKEGGGEETGPIIFHAPTHPPTHPPNNTVAQASFSLKLGLLQADRGENLQYK